MTPHQLRRLYVQYFLDRGHVEIPSSSLVPENDPTTLFTGSGMQPMVPYLLGETHPQGSRIVDIQKCFRSVDIDEVGDNRHTTFFEMLGNWSLGDYFKAEQIPWVFDFLSNHVGLDPEKLYITVYRGNSQFNLPKDDEAVEIWRQVLSQAGIEPTVIDMAEQTGRGDGRIFYYPDSENWWSRSGEPAKMPTGEPGGPSSEIYYDFGPEFAAPAGVDHFAGDCARYLEIGNSVFMTYQRTGTGFSELKNKNIDFGGGLERILAAANNDPDVFKTTAFWPIMEKLQELSQFKYADQDSNIFSFRVIADHLRAAVMMAADGVLPDNKERGYFARRLVRRSIRHGQQLGMDKPFIAEIVPVVAQLFSDDYPEVANQVDSITTALQAEEAKFRATLQTGLRQFRKLKTQVIDGQVAFDLYQTYGFPLELSLEEAAQQQIEVSDDIKTEFDAAKLKHAEQSRTASAGKFKGGLAEHSEITTKYHTATHLLQAALRKILGDHVAQQGSNITDQRLRFDFSHPQKLTEQEKQQVEELVNTWIQQDLPVTKQIMDKDEALKSGAIAFFREKYSDQVSVYTVGEDTRSNWVSKELCGGPHVDKTGQIGSIKLTKEQSAGANVRRIYMELA